MTRTPLSKPQEKKLDAVRAAFKDETVGEHAVRLGRQMLKYKAGIRSTPPGKSMFVNLSTVQAAKVRTLLGIVVEKPKAARPKATDPVAADAARIEREYRQTETARRTGDA